MCSFSYVHVYRIEYVSYRQGTYRIRIVSAADRIVPALSSRRPLPELFNFCPWGQNLLSPGCHNFTLNYMKNI